MSVKECVVGRMIILYEALIIPDRDQCMSPADRCIACDTEVYSSRIIAEPEGILDELDSLPSLLPDQADALEHPVVDHLTAQHHGLIAVRKF